MITHVMTDYHMVPEKRGRVSSGYILASSHDKRASDTLYRGGNGPCVP